MKYFDQKKYVYGQIIKLLHVEVWPEARWLKQEEAPVRYLGGAVLSATIPCAKQGFTGLEDQRPLGEL